MRYATIRQDGHRTYHVRHEPIDLRRRHQPDEIRLGFQERLPAIGHQIVHVGYGLNRHVIQRLPKPIPLRFML
ncbi:MAG TPA: hypothetical protein VJZ71_17415 [Phycisphaerae bacterium]|nr:hypothetical protein [Phycisphaerae bacterium]